MNGIEVKVSGYGRKNLYARWADPVTGQQAFHDTIVTIKKVG